jgi:hypothetical protein
VVETALTEKAKMKEMKETKRPVIRQTPSPNHILALLKSERESDLAKKRERLCL